MVLKKGSAIRLTPLPHETKYFERGIFPQRVKDKYAEGSLTLDDLFDEFEDVNVFLQITATDMYSGATKFFESRRYTKNDIRNGVFRGAKFDVVEPREWQK